MKRFLSMTLMLAMVAGTVGCRCCGWGYRGAYYGDPGCDPCGSTCAPPCDPCGGYGTMGGYQAAPGCATCPSPSPAPYTAPPTS